MFDYITLVLFSLLSLSFSPSLSLSLSHLPRVSSAPLRLPVCVCVCVSLCLLTCLLVRSCAMHSNPTMPTTTTTRFSAPLCPASNMGKNGRHFSNDKYREVRPYKPWISRHTNIRIYTQRISIDGLFSCLCSPRA